MEPDDLPLFPAWRQALRTLVRAGIHPGQIITRDWLNDAFGIRGAMTVAEVQRNALAFLRQMTDLREALLKNHQVMLRAEPGIGFRVIEPRNQTAIAMRDRQAEIKRSFEKLALEVSCIKVEALDDASRKENSDAAAKVGAMQALMRPHLKADIRIAAPERKSS